MMFSGLLAREKECEWLGVVENGVDLRFSAFLMRCSHWSWNFSRGHSQLSRPMRSQEIFKSRKVAFLQYRMGNAARFIPCPHKSTDDCADVVLSRFFKWMFGKTKIPDKPYLFTSTSGVSGKFDYFHGNFWQQQVWYLYWRCSFQ